MAGHQVWERASLLAKVKLFQKEFTKEVISVASSLVLMAKTVSSMVLENWFVVIVKSQT